MGSQLSIHASHQGVDESSADSEDSDSSDRKLASHRGRVSSGIKGSHSAESSLSSPAPPPSAIEGNPFPISYDNPPPSSVRVPSGIEGYYFPDLYDAAYPTSPPSSGSSSTLMGNLPTVPPEEAASSFERQYHFYDDPVAM